MDEATTAHGPSSQSTDIGKRGDMAQPAFPFLYDDADSDEEEEYDIDDDDDNTDTDPASAFALTKPPSSPTPSTPRTMKITMPFMRAYKAMRGPRDVEPSPLFACLRKHPREREEGHDVDPLQNSPDPSVLVGGDEVKLLNQVANSLYTDDYDGIDDDHEIAYVYTRRIQALSEDDEDGDSGTSACTVCQRSRQTVFFFEPPVAPPPIPDQQKSQAIVSCSSSSCEDCSSCRSCVSCRSCSAHRGCDVVADRVLEGAHLDAGWLAIGADEYVSDDDGAPADTRLTPATFRALAAGCTRNDVDTLRLRTQPKPASSSIRFRTPRTPPNKRKIVPDRHADYDSRLNNVRPHRHRRQFDFYTGEELSPLYQVERGSGGGGGGGPLVWSPPGLTPERAGFLLRERKPGLSDGGGGRGSGSGDWSMLFQRMAPTAYQELRTRLYRDAAADGASEQGGESEEDEESDDERMVAAETLLELHNGWKAVEAAQIEDTRLEAAHAQAEAILTAQARCLTRLEHAQETEMRSSIGTSSIGCSRSTCRRQHIEGRPSKTPREARQRMRKPSPRLHGNPSVEMHMRVREAEARVAQAWERQRVLAQRVQQGEARLAREAAAVVAGRTKARLLDELAVELAQMGVH